MLGARSFDAIELNRSRLYALYPYILNSIRDAHMAYMIASKEGNRDAKAYMLSLYNAMEKLDEPIQPIFKKEAFQDALTNRWPLAEEFTEYLYSLERNDIHEEYDTSLFNPKMLTAKSSLLKKQLMEHNDRLQKHIVKLHEGAKKSDAHALIELAHRYCAGSGVECSFFKAMKLYTKALFQADEDGQKEICSVLESFYQEGSLTAAFELTLFYLSKNEFGVAIPLIRYIFSSREYLDSFSDYIESYDKGRLEGIRKQSHLAFLTLKCTERKKASVLYESKEHNDEVDYANWGMLSYLLEDYANAIIYFEKSRTLISSIFHLGKIYLHGLGLECPDKEKAYSCLETLFSPDRLHINAGTQMLVQYIVFSFR